jgi:hypothetical protein
MSAAVVHQPRTILPKFNFLLAGTAVVLSIIAITDNVGSKTVTATATKPAAVATQKAGAGTARPEHAVVVHTVTAKAPAVTGRILDESVLAHEVGAKVTASQPSIGRLMNDVGPAVKAPAVTGRILDESVLANAVGAKITSQPSIGRLLNDVGPVQASTVAGTCGFKVGTTC